MVEFGNRCSSLIDAPMVLVMDLASNLVLLLRVCNNLLTLQPQLLGFVALTRRKLVMSSCTTETALLCSVSTIGILSVLEIEANLVEALLRHKLVILA